MLRGSHPAKVDDKGRLKLPADFRSKIEEEYGSKFYITASVEVDSIHLYPLPVWEEIERKLMRLPTLNPQVRRLQRLMVGHATDLELDSHGRVLVPPKLREYAGLTRQAMLIGQGSRFELWDETHWNERRESWLQAGDETGDLPSELEQLSL
jgi:MraZ protein